MNITNHEKALVIEALRSMKQQSSQQEKEMIEKLIQKIKGE